LSVFEIIGKIVIISDPSAGAGGLGCTLFVCPRRRRRKVSEGLDGLKMGEFEGKQEPKKRKRAGLRFVKGSVSSARGKAPGHTEYMIGHLLRKKGRTSYTSRRKSCRRKQGEA
jgi:hypothetical protein